jgi:hypothetical protein
VDYSLLEPTKVPGVDDSNKWSDRKKPPMKNKFFLPASTMLASLLV